MLRCALVSMLFASLSYGQNAASRSVLVASPGNERKTSEVAQDQPVISITGLCGISSADNIPAPTCKTVITRLQFEKLVDAVQPGMRARGRREFAERYAEALVMATKAEQMGLDKGANFEEQMKLARIDVLSKDLKRAIQAKTSQISDEDIEDYYHNNMIRFEKAKIERIYVPRSRASTVTADTKPSDTYKQMHSQESEQNMKELANSLRARAIAGEDFTKLQADAYQASGIKSSPPATSMEIRRISLPPNQVSVMDSKPGEVSLVFTDPNGYFIYKIETKDTLPLDQAREEIKETIRFQRMRDEMLSILNSARPILDESYFAR